MIKLLATCGVGDSLHPKEIVPGSRIDQVRQELPTIAASNDALTRRYFEKVAGHWSGTYRFRITDHAAMHAVVPRRIDRLRLSMLHHLPAHMATSVSCVNEDLVRHATRITSLGICCMDSEETFHLHENGNQFTVAMSQMVPTQSGTNIVTEISIYGILSFIWSRMIGKKHAQGIAAMNEKLIDRARALSVD